jgi:hypothetical protein
MHVLLAIGRLCLKNWKKLIPWALFGPLVIVLYGTGSGTGGSLNWGTFITSGVIFGAFIGMLIQVNESRGKKNQSLKMIDRDIRNLSERELHIAFSVLGALLGVLIARLLELTLVAYPICAALFVLLALSRNSIEKVLP